QKCQRPRTRRCAYIRRHPLIVAVTAMEPYDSTSLVVGYGSAKDIPQGCPELPRRGWCAVAPPSHAELVIQECQNVGVFLDPLVARRAHAMAGRVGAQQHRQAGAGCRLHRTNTS